MERYWAVVRSSALTLTALVAVTGVLLSIAVGATLASGQRATAAEQLERRATLIAEAVAGEAGRYIDSLRTVAAAAGAFEPLTAATFTKVTQPLADMGLAGATSIAFLVPVADGDLTAVQARWRARGVPDLALQPKSAAGEHIFSIFSQPLDGTTTPRHSIDVTQSASATRALTEARRSGRVTLSDPYQLIIDQQLPPEQRQLSFVFTAPVYAADAARTFQGWVMLGIRGFDLIGATLTRVSQNLVDVTLRAQRADGTYQPVATHQAQATGDRDLTFDAQIPVADRIWQLHIAAAGRRLPGAATGMPTVAAGAGATLTLLLAGLVWALATGRTRARAQVQAATADLAAAEEAARDQADLLTAIMDCISDGVTVIDRDGRWLLHNPAANAIFGAGGAQPATWQEHYGLYLPDSATPFPTADIPLLKALHGEEPEQVEMLVRNTAHPDGLIISVSARPLHSNTGHTGAVAVYHDITARKAADAQLTAATDALRTELAARTAAEAELRAARDALEQQKAYLTQILDALDVAVITCDTSGAIVHANLPARRTMPADGNAATLATAFAGLSHLDGRPVSADDTPLARALRGEDVDGMEAVVALPDGSTTAVLLHARTLTDTGGTIIGAVAASYNVTVLREREADLRAFAGVAAHDLRAPLAALAGHAEILDEDLPADTDPALRHSLHRIRAGVERMRRLIDDLLAYATARDAPLQPEAVDLHELVADVIAERIHHLRHPTTDGPPVLFPDIYTGPLPVVRADKAMIRQLLDNLIGNAIKYTMPGQPARIDISAHQRPGDDSARIEIADRGIGIPDTEKPHVFASFRRAGNHGDRPGTGLGLAICQRIIDRHHSTISVTDNPGGGTRICFTLPTADPNTTDPPAVRAAPPTTTAADR
ncbi:hypothetical protein Acy02nite_47310 [Actinoplanes cyaneus]|uniref:Sensor-like histidine kinase SenX3 n=1 Tax=Actinoplanes cyaneus TaxID=52696 RepID=A0A919IRQ9_9ACTN|nr:ATP-binding protein [Actinoplanes cyaneus]MCW2138816.1 PAS domain S-box-containing protein [Actinoplanes cyaneus]GID66850.1 hypothetical protein Acy02nite_47310 [Actinoplanes cyaneus]